MCLPALNLPDLGIFFVQILNITIAKKILFYSRRKKPVFKPVYLLFGEIERGPYFNYDCS
jgi:hypothetical protein